MNTSRLQWVRINRGREHRPGCLRPLLEPRRAGLGLWNQLPSAWALFPVESRSANHRCSRRAGSPFPSCPPNWRQVGIHVDARTGKPMDEGDGNDNREKTSTKRLSWIMASRDLPLLVGQLARFPVPVRRSRRTTSPTRTSMSLCKAGCCSAFAFQELSGNGGSYRA